MEKEHEKNHKEQEEPKEDKGLITEEELIPAEAKKEVPEAQDLKIQDLNNQLLRLRAEFENYRNRVEKEKQHKYILGKESILSKVLDFEDVFEKAVQSLHQWHSDENPKDIKSVISGIELLKKEFTNFLKKEGVKHLDVMGKKVDPMLHEVVGFEISGDKEEGVIIKEVQRGYSYDEYVLRPSKVIVSKIKEEEDKESKIE